MGTPLAVAVLAPEILQSVIQCNMDIGVSGAVKCLCSIGGGCAITSGCVSTIGGCVGTMGCVVLS